MSRAQYVGLNGTWELVAGKIKTSIDLQQLFNKNPELSSSQYNRSFQVAGSISYQFSKIGLRFELRNNYFGESNTFNLASDGELINTSQDAYNMAAVYLHKSFFKSALRFSLGVENILDQQALNGSRVSAGVHSSSRSQLIHPGKTLVFNINYTFK